MATVQRRDRQNIHESKDDRQESCHVPELVPVPRSREDTADRSETAQLLRSFFREQVFHIAHIAFQRFHTKRDACREVNVTDDGVGSTARLDWNRFADTVTGPLTRAVREDRYTLLRKAVEALPENDRQILELRHFDDMSNADCAEVLHIGPKAASIRYVRALQRLRKQLMELTEFQP